MSFVIAVSGVLGGGLVYRAPYDRQLANGIYVVRLRQRAAYFGGLLPGFTGDYDEAAQWPLPFPSPALIPNAVNVLAFVAVPVVGGYTWCVGARPVWKAHSVKWMEVFSGPAVTLRASRAEGCLGLGIPSHFVKSC